MDFLVGFQIALPAKVRGPAQGPEETRLQRGNPGINVCLWMGPQTPWITF